MTLPADAYAPAASWRLAPVRSHWPGEVDPATVRARATVRANAEHRARTARTYGPQAVTAAEQARLHAITKTNLDRLLTEMPHTRARALARRSQRGVVLTHHTTCSHAHRH
jgi:hypothetical protein